MLNIVGTRYRPPAGTILGNLPQGFPLLLIREPTNTFDPNAIMVCLPAGWEEELSSEALSEIKTIVSMQGDTWPKPFTPFQLGYIPKEIAKNIAPAMDEDGGMPIACTLGFQSSGAPAVITPEGEEEKG